MGVSEPSGRSKVSHTHYDTPEEAARPNAGGILKARRSLAGWASLLDLIELAPNILSTSGQLSKCLSAVRVVGADVMRIE